MSQIVVIDSGSGNLHSVQRALETVGATVVVTADPARVRSADRLVVPGQGAYPQCMRTLRERGLDEAIRDFVATGRPYFGICLGLQVLFEHSDEQGGADGLGLLGGQVLRFRHETTDLKVPHMGWNSVHATKSEPLMSDIPDGGHFYFVHSFYVAPKDPDVTILRCHYGHDFAAAIRCDNLFACQFHPEKSQKLGLELLANFCRL